MPTDFKQPFTFDRVIRIIITLLIVFGVFIILQRLQNILAPFIIALLLAYLINPLVQFFQGRLKIKHRVIAVALSFITISMVSGLALLLILPTISNEMSKMAELLSAYAKNAELIQYIPDNLEASLQEFAASHDVQQFFNQENLTAIVKEIVPGFWNFFSGSLNFIMGLFGIFIIFLYLIFILIDYDEFANSWSNYIPPSYRDSIVSVVEDVEDAMNNYFRAQALIAFLTGIAFAIGFSIIGLPMAILFGLFIGALNMIPYLQNVALIPAIFLALLHSLETDQSFGVMISFVLIVFLLAQVLQDAYLTPKIMGNATGLNPAIMLLALSIWGSLLGMLGLMIALPVSALLISYYQRFIQKIDGRDLSFPLKEEN